MRLPLLFLALMCGFTLKSQVVSSSITHNNPKAIGPLIFGYNQHHEDVNGPENWKARRLGGNRMMTYNWENNASNAGHDYLYSSDNYLPNSLGLSAADKDKPGELLRHFHQENLDAGITSIITVPISGWVAADKLGANTTTPPSARWDELVYQKGSAFSLTPDLNDGKVYLDECINFLIQTFGDATTATGVKYIALDNEPALWTSLNPYLQPTKLGCEEYVNKVIDAAVAVKSVDPNVKIIVGEFSGINLYDFSSAPDWATVGAGYDWFPSYFLDKLSAANDFYGFELIDVISFHNYPQHTIDSNGDFLGGGAGGVTVRTEESTADHIRKARMNFPRSMWDINYVEPSWLTQYKTLVKQKPLKLFHRFKESIDTYYPGVRLMLGEYDYGHDVDVSHGVGVVELLSSACAHDLEIVTRWDLKVGNTNTYTSTAYQLMRNYDGSNSSIGDQQLGTISGNGDLGSIWATQDSDDGDLHLILINRSLSDSVNFEVYLNVSDLDYEIGGLYQLNDKGTSIENLPIQGQLGGLVYAVKLEAETATHVVLRKKSVATGMLEEVELEGLQFNSVTKILSGLTGYYTLTNLEGKVVLSGSTPEVNLGQLPSGFYLVVSGDEQKKIYLD